MEVVAYRDIRPGEEITISCGFSSVPGRGADTDAEQPLTH